MGDKKPDLISLDLCFLDTETTGPRFGHHEIIDVAAVRTTPDGGTIRGTWHKRIRPRHPERITDFARKHNGFEVSEWDREPLSSNELWEDFARFAKDAVPVCHNPAFDRAFVELEASHQGVQVLGLDYHWIGTESLAWVLYRRGDVKRINLEALLESFELDPEPRPHTALKGAQSCRLAYLVLMRTIGAPGPNAPSGDN